MSPIIPFTLLVLMSMIGHTESKLSHTAQLEGGETLRFSITEGNLNSHFIRDRRVSAHLLLRSGNQARVIVAFPGGNSGVGVWFEPTEREAKLTADSQMKVVLRDSMHGIHASIHADANELKIKDVGLGGLRFLRRYSRTHSFPPEMSVKTDLGKSASFSRDSFDGIHHYELEVIPGEGTTLDRDDGTGKITLRSQNGGLHFELIALSDEAPLTPIPLDRLVHGETNDHNGQTAKRALAFLSYKEKLLAGSWRFLTYFGRDTLLSLDLMMSVADRAILEAGLGAVLDRLNAKGEVAHEEDIGDWAAFRRMRTPSIDGEIDEPIYDYKMIDDDFLLAPIMADYLRKTRDHPEEVFNFLARETPSGEKYIGALARNIRFVLRRAAPYGDNPIATNLIALQDGKVVGDWRDSTEGLAHGIYPYSVNAAFVHGALKAVVEILTNEHFAAAFEGDAPRLLKTTKRLEEIWRDAYRHFLVTMPYERAKDLVRAYASKIGLPVPQNGLENQSGKASFFALSLDRSGKPIPVMHSDIGFFMMFNEPSPEALDVALNTLAATFPWGLRTPLGIVVANPSLSASATIEREFTTSAYHGTVIWSWQHATLLAGLKHQMARQDLPEELQRKLKRVDAFLKEIVSQMTPHQHEELWTFKIEDGHLRFQAFGQEEGHASESNTVQLWSTVFLGADQW